MAMDKYKVPNWAQTQILWAVGFDPSAVAVVNEDDRHLLVLHYESHTEYSISKADGRVSER